MSKPGAWGSVPRKLRSLRPADFILSPTRGTRKNTKLSAPVCYLKYLLRKNRVALDFPKDQNKDSGNDRKAGLYSISKNVL